MWWLIIPVGVIVGAWLYGAKNVSAANPVPGFTSPGIPMVGDIATVALVSVEEAFSEIAINGPAGSTSSNPQMTAADQVLLNAIPPGGTAQFQLTAVNLIGDPGTPAAGVPCCIGVMVNPPVSVRSPGVFLSASIQTLTRSGAVVTK